MIVSLRTSVFPLGGILTGMAYGCRERGDCLTWGARVAFPGEATLLFFFKGDAHAGTVVLSLESGKTARTTS